MTRYVLVHGAFAGAWCWEPVVAELERRGHSCRRSTCRALARTRRRWSEVSLAAYAARVCEALAAETEPAVLVGHSMGGMVITQAASRCPERVTRLVYAAAFLPRDGQSLVGLTELPEGAGDGVQANMTVAGDPPVATMTAEAAREVFFGACTDEQAAWALAHLGTQPVLPFLTPVALSPAVDEIPRSYVLCTADRSIPPALQRHMVAASPCDEVVELDVDHSPWLSATLPLVDVLER